MATMKELEISIGFPPFSQRPSDEALLMTDTKVLGYARLWLGKQGLPDKVIRSALPKSVATAYVSKPYLNAWRRRVNPAWDLLDGGDGDDEGTSSTSLAETQEEAPPPPTSTTPPANVEAWTKDLFAQVNKAVNLLVEDKLSKATLKLDDSAKQQIRQLARDSASQRIDEMAKPQVIEVHDHIKGEVISLGLQHEKFPTLLRAVQARDHRGFRLNIWLTGPTGSGKTSAGEAVAKALSLDFGSDGSLDADYKVLGFRDANGNIISTEFIRIYEGGGIYIADEIDNWMPSALLSLNAALANGWMTTPKGLIKRHPDACVIACANTWGLGATSDYVGRTRLDAASLDRFHPKINWPVDEKLERAVAEQQGGKEGLVWLNIVTSARHAASRQGLKVIISPRATFTGIALLQAGFSLREVVDMTLAAGLSPEQAKAIGLHNIGMFDPKDEVSVA
jgi:cobaltochelatase CobS